METSNTNTAKLEEFRLRNVERLDSVVANLEEAMAKIEEVSLELQPESTAYYLLLGQILPKIKHLISNSEGIFSISDLILLLKGGFE